MMEWSNIKRGGSILAGYLRAYIYNRLRIPGPLQRLAVSVTGACNSRCITCGLWHKKPDRKNELTLDDMERLAGSGLVKNVASVVITGGEPFLRDDVADIIEIFKTGTSAQVSVITNGLLPDRIRSTVSEVKRRGLDIDKIALSLNGKPDTHDRTRGVEGGFHKIIDTVKYLRNLNVYTGLIFTIMQENHDEIEWAYGLSRELGVPINFYPEVGSYRFDNLNSARELTREKMDTVIRQLKGIFSRRRYYYFDDSTLYYIEKMRRGEEVCRCYGGDQSAYVAWDGEVYACEGFFDTRYSFGNIKEKPFDEIWRSDKAGEMRNYIKEGKCQPCYLSCEIIPSLRKEIFPVIAYTLKRRFGG